MKDKLTIEPVYATGPDGKATSEIATYRMFGYVENKKIRRQSTELAALEKERDTLLKRADDVRAMERSRPVDTFLSVSQAREAENLFREFRGLPRPLTEYIRAGVAALGNGGRVLIFAPEDADAKTKATAAAVRWEENMRGVTKKTSAVKIADNLINLRQFVEFAGITYADEISTDNFEAFISRPKISTSGPRKGQPIGSQTRLDYGLKLQAFINFCRTKKIIRHTIEIDLTGLVRLAKEERDPVRILTPAQCESYLHAAIEIEPRLVIRIILGLWCFIRQEEIDRLTRANLHMEHVTPAVSLLGRKKGSQPRTVNIPANVLPLFRECLDAGYWPEGTHPYDSINLEKKVRAEAGLIQLGPPGSGGSRPILAVGNEWQASIQRHSGISYFYNLTKDIKETVFQAGNSGDTAFEHYIKLPKQGDAQKFYAITGALKKGVAQADAQAVA